ncbi:hypothetical protein BaRGS_00033184 [Batillaria attramentaria]|uniref:Uncharacterized protein n=1 Tax=Batillaria attramentaria TaxID=370345 RepID=A0ABD0JKZ4_9CAEN
MTRRWRPSQRFGGRFNRYCCVCRPKASHQSQNLPFSDKRGVFFLKGNIMLQDAAPFWTVTDENSSYKQGTFETENVNNELQIDTSQVSAVPQQYRRVVCC